MGPCMGGIPSRGMPGSSPSLGQESCRIPVPCCHPCVDQGDSSQPGQGEQTGEFAQFSKCLPTLAFNQAHNPHVLCLMLQLRVERVKPWSPSPWSSPRHIDSHRAMWGTSGQPRPRRARQPGHGDAAVAVTAAASQGQTPPPPLPAGK